MKFMFDDEKAAQAAAFVLQLLGGELYHVHLNKLLYLADRQALLETGYPVTGAKMVSTDHGPALSEVYQRLTWGAAAETPWSVIIENRAEHKVALRHVPDWEKLSPYDEDVLTRIVGKWGHWDRWDLVRYTHELPEWHDPEGSSWPIDVREILEDAGKSPQEIEDIAAQAESIRLLHQMTESAGR